MDTATQSSPRNGAPFLTHCWKWISGEPLICLLLAIVALITLFYLEENWRGKRSWQRCRRELEAKGAKLDWPAFIPAAIPEEKNMFKAPKMEEWFAGKGLNELTSLLNAQSIYQFATQISTNAILEIKTGPTNDAAWPASLTLRYAPPILTKISAGEKLPRPAGHETNIIPVLTLDGVTLSEAIRNLARIAKVKYEVDANMKLVGGTAISIRWHHVTALQALVTLLNDYDLKLIDNPRTGVARIRNRNPGDPQVYVEPEVRRELRKIFETEFRFRTNVSTGRSAKAPQGFTLLAFSPVPDEPAHIFVEAEDPPTPGEIVEFFPVSNQGATTPATRPRVDILESNRFQVFASPRQTIIAADYLAWSDQFAPEFELIRAGLKRPYAQLPGNYQQPFSRPMPNFQALRILAQTLAQRTQSYLLLGQPELALRELTLMHELCRLLQAESGSRPVTLVAAMIEVVIRGLYVSAFCDGLRLNVWREPQLAAFQAQLEKVNLLQAVWESLVQERAAVCWTFDTSTANQFMTPLGSPGMSTWDRLKDPSFLFFTFGPRGWAYQNKVTIATLEQNFLAGIDPIQRIVQPHQLDLARHQMESTFKHLRPYAFLASLAAPNFGRAVRRAARSHAFVDQAIVVCALERYRLSHLNYPETMAALVPQFAARLPHDLINGKPLIYRGGKDQFLLYSIGWNETDDGGVPDRNETGNPDSGQGDWVWRLSIE